MNISHMLFLGQLQLIHIASFGLIGSRGSIGNFISKHPDSIPIYRNNQNHLKILSKDEMIIAAVPFRSVEDVLKTIPSERQKDLVFLCNGMVNLDQVSTCAALYFGVKEDGSLITSDNPPFTSVFGLHAENFARVLGDLGVKTEVIKDLPDFERLRFAKLVWSSAFWLLCHCHCHCHVGSVPIGKVDKKLQNDLIDELIDVVTKSDEFNLGPNNRTQFPQKEMKRDVLDYASLMQHVTPSFELAMEEIESRNGWFTARCKTDVHSRLLQSIKN